MTGAEARRTSTWTIREKLGRAVWELTQATLFRYSPRPFYKWRGWLLRRFGARVHTTAHIHPTVQIDVPWNLRVGAYTSVGDAARLYCLGSVILGDRVTISQHAHLCAGTHDYSDSSMPLLRPPILVDDDAWVAADAFIGPGVTVGPGTIVGARAVVVRSFEPWVVLVGNPARVVKRRLPPA